MFKVKALTATTGVTYRQVDFWVRRGYIKPIQAGQGKGSGLDRFFFAEDYAYAQKLARLVAAGCGIHMARAIMDKGYLELKDGYRLVLQQKVEGPAFSGWMEVHK